MGIKTGFSLDSKRPTIDLGAYISQETRLSVFQRSNPERAEQLLREEEACICEKYALLERLMEQ
ncbi:MAG: hypothetical protein LBS71_00780 [Puniceicoccales bacterium]|jgi:hypothetical protein|nr:hypothetical protein [Puniceicoccales bacterium]